MLKRIFHLGSSSGQAAPLPLAARATAGSAPTPRMPPPPAAKREVAPEKLLFRKTREQNPEPPVTYDRSVGVSWARRDRKTVHILKVGADPRSVPANRTNLTGESHYQVALTQIAGSPTHGVVRFRTELALLIPEPDNQYDPNAIAVKIGDQLVGYFPRDIASQYCAAIRLLGKDGKPVGCKAEVRGSDLYGVSLFFDPEVLSGAT